MLSIKIPRYGLKKPLPLLSKTIYTSNEVPTRLESTHSGYNIETDKHYYKISINKNASKYCLNYTNFYTRANSEFLPNSELVKQGRKYFLIREEKIQTTKEHPTFEQIVHPLSSLLNDSLTSQKEIYPDIYIESNFGPNPGKKLARTISESIFKINSLALQSINIGLTHGDLWYKNTLIDRRERIKFIDFDRSSPYDFPEMDIINWYVMDKVYNTSERPSWIRFAKIITELRESHEALNTLKDQIDAFLNISNIDNTQLDLITHFLNIYVAKILYNNDNSLEGITYLRWRIKRPALSKLLPI